MTMKEMCIKKSESSSLIDCSGSHSDKAGLTVHTANEGRERESQEMGTTGELTGENSQDSSEDPKATAASNLPNNLFIVSSFINSLY